MDDSKPVVVPKEFIAAFEAVAERYRLRELGEYEIAKEAARRDINGAMKCFAELAKHTA